MLAGKGFKDVINVKGGLNAWQGNKAAGPAEEGMSTVTGAESPEQIITIAYGMEEGLGKFYTAMAGRLSDSGAMALLTRLAAIEDNHKKKLFEVYKDLKKSDINESVFQSSIVSDMMEGGFTVQEFMETNAPALQTVEDILSMAMMLETQALDLYLRFSGKIKDEKSHEILSGIANDEKAHLAALGDLMETEIKNTQ